MHLRDSEVGLADVSVRAPENYLFFVSNTMHSMEDIDFVPKISMFDSVTVLVVMKTRSVFKIIVNIDAIL